jgi:hypothetical protein
MVSRPPKARKAEYNHRFYCHASLIIELPSPRYGKRARYGNAQAIIRCGEPMQFQLSGLNRAASSMGGLANCAMME